MLRAWWSVFMREVDGRESERTVKGLGHSEWELEMRI
jgi:hypothetical protein